MTPIRSSKNCILSLLIGPDDALVLSDCPGTGLIQFPPRLALMTFSPGQSLIPNTMGDIARASRMMELNLLAKERKYELFLVPRDRWWCPEKGLVMVQGDFQEGNLGFWHSYTSRLFSGKLYSFPVKVCFLKSWGEDVKSLCQLNAKKAMAFNSRRED